MFSTSSWAEDRDGVWLIDSWTCHSSPDACDAGRTPSVPVTGRSESCWQAGFSTGPGAALLPDSAPASRHTRREVVGVSGGKRIFEPQGDSLSGLLTTLAVERGCCRLGVSIFLVMSCHILHMGNKNYFQQKTT